MRSTPTELMLVLVTALALAGCSDFILEGPAQGGNRHHATTDGQPAVEDDGGALPKTDAGVPAPETDGGSPPPPKPDSGSPPPPPKPDTGVPPKPDTGVPPKPDMGAPPKQDMGAPPKPDTGAPPATSCGNSYETEVLALVNAERAKQGKAALKCHLPVAAVARAYSQSMCDNRFFSHTGHDGSSPWDRIKAAGISYKGAGENIAAGQKDPAAVMNSWMNSSGHRANILGNFTHLGTGYVTCPGGKYSRYWTQNFLRL